ncbi:PorP/SprF family type IX secretion system membrane protein [Flavobacterium psychrophilum]|uniref:PorP/SprF family type IX secretion system membrane protein n=1 Tax=Flavobacterium psychrophilum TaxID=96345 RepID=UPI00106D3580|nr:PorP/SprF family type IX secretion system membrane protein [Flavobacterium psychrophilum]
MKKMVYFILFGGMSCIYGQQEASFTQYSISPSIVNPAYAASDFTTNIGVAVRKQWESSFEQKSILAFGQIPINERIEMSFNITSDDMAKGIVNQKFIGLNLAYILKTSDKARLSFGIRGGVNLLSKNFENIILEQGTVLDDKAFDVMLNDKSTTPIIGAGIFFYKKKYFIGLSIPSLIKTDNFYANGNKVTFLSKSDKFLTAGYIFNLNTNIKIKPNLLLKYNEGLFYPNGLLNILFYERFEIGYMNKINISNNFMLGFTLGKNFTFNYTYEVFNKPFGKISSNSNEFSIRYKFSNSKNNVVSPRFY